MASIEERRAPNGALSYRVKVRLKGFPTQTATFARKTDAKKWAKQIEVAIAEGRHFKTTEAKKHTLAEMVERFSRDELPKLPKVAPFLGSQLQWWSGQLGERSLADVTPALIAECRDRLHRDGTNQKSKIAAATVNRYLTALSLTYTRAIREWGWVEYNPLRKVAKLKEPRGRIRFLSDNERVRLLEACLASTNQHLYPVVVLAVSTGMRKAEIMNLRWADVDLNQGRITIHETKNNERRVVPLVSRAQCVIKEHRKIRRLDTNFLFPSKNGQKPVALRAPWLQALEAAQIEDFRFHDLRHSAASYFAMNGATLAEIAEVLGHKTLSMVMRYAHLSEQHTATVVASMNAKIFGS